MQIRNTSYRRFEPGPDRIPVWMTLCVIATPGMLTGLVLWVVSGLLHAESGMGGIIGQTCFWSGMFLLSGNGIILLFGILGWFLRRASAEY